MNEEICCVTCAEIIFFFFFSVEKGELCLRLENNSRVYCSCQFFARKVIKSGNTDPTLFNSEKEHVGKVASRMTALTTHFLGGFNRR